METVYQLLAIISAGLISWLIYRTVKSQPEQFSQKKINQSLFSMGVLALILIAFVALLVLSVR